jgi:hypothetical protein
MFGERVQSEKCRNLWQNMNIVESTIFNEVGETQTSAVNP